MRVFTITWLTIPIYIASFMFFVCHKSRKPDTYRIWATCDRLFALLARRTPGCRDLYIDFVLIFSKMGGYVRVLCPLQCPFFLISCLCVFMSWCHRVLPCLSLPCLALHCIAWPSLAMGCLALPCIALPSLPLPCLALPCLVLSRFALPCLA